MSNRTRRTNLHTEVPFDKGLESDEPLKRSRNKSKSKQRKTQTQQSPRPRQARQFRDRNHEHAVPIHERLATSRERSTLLNHQMVVDPTHMYIQEPAYLPKYYRAYKSVGMKTKEREQSGSRERIVLNPYPQSGANTNRSLE